MEEVITALLFALSLVIGGAAIKSSEIRTGYIFLGDSRTVGMNDAVQIEDDNKFVVAKVGEGYKWMVETGLMDAADIIEENPKINNWVLISNFGVNDLYNVDSYIDAYEQISEIMPVYVVSVNPCKGSYDELNSEIDSFNEKMKNLDCVTYVDTCTALRNDGFSSSDGLHYGAETYNKIYDMVTTSVFSDVAASLE